MRSFITFLLIVSSNAFSQGIEWLPIGDPVNDPWPAITPPSISFGSVFYHYEISKYEITNNQYVGMLSAVAAADPNGLWNSNMGANSLGGITRTGTSGSYLYQVKPGLENRSVNYVSFYDAIRYANWLHNGMPGGGQNSNTTEDGAYTITASGITNNSIVRNADAEYAVPTWDEWRKAGYYDTGTGTWYTYPAQSDTQMLGSDPASDVGNNGNCSRPQFIIYDVGSYTLSEGPNGTFDQGGNVVEWTETIAPSARKYVGSSYAGSCSGTSVLSFVNRNPGNEDQNGGFRLVRPGESLINIPIPGWALALLGAALIVGGALKSQRILRTR